MIFNRYQLSFAIIVIVQTLCPSSHCILSAQQAPTVSSSKQPIVSFSFDDGSTTDYPRHSHTEWNARLLATLKKHKLHAMFFVKGSGMDNVAGRAVMKSWSAEGHSIANHSYSHFNFSSKRISLDTFQKDFLFNHQFLKNLDGFVPFFRFPYLKEGNTREKVDGFRAFLKQNSYLNGHVSIDASDWYVNTRLLKRLETDSTADIKLFEKFYIQHLFDRACFYDSLATEMTGRKIHHVLLLHHNLAASLFLDQLIEHFEKKGWRVCSTLDAYKDPFYTSESSSVPAGESLVWSLAKQSGRFDAILRYPAEDSEYEEAEMDRLGL